MEETVETIKERVVVDMGSYEFENYLQKIDRYCVFLQYWVLLNVFMFCALSFWNSAGDMAIIFTILIAFLIFHIVMFRNTILMLYDRTEAIVDMVATFIPFIGGIVVLYNLDECRNKIIKEGHTFKFGRLHNYR